MLYGIYNKLMSLNPSFSSRKNRDTTNTASTSTAARRQACRALLAKSDRQLTDMGFSRDLLEKGVKAWPWLVASDTSERLVTSAPATTFVPTVHYTDIGIEKKHEVLEKQRYAA